MLQIMNLKRERKAQLNQHPFYGWINGENVPLEEKLLFAPIMSLFVMNFRDANKWFIRFPEASSRFEEIINGNTFEDETHSRLFLEDWKKLDLDSRLGWRASDTIWWLFLAELTEPFRRFVMDFARMCVVDKGDPMVRFAHSEAGEACGNMFFSIVAPIADQLEAKTGIKYRYFGSHHLDREPGHVIGSTGVFESQTLTEAQRHQGTVLATKMFDIFMEMHDCFLRYAQEYTARGVFPHPPEGYARRPVVESAASAPPAAERGGAMAPNHAEVERRLQERKARTAKHEFYAWLRQEDGLSPKQKLQRFITMWTGDIMGYRDLNRYALRYPAARNPGEAVINRWCDDLESHNVLFMNDWHQLKMDEVLGWNASETFKFYFLDRQMDIHRRNMCNFVKLAIGYERPAMRFWLMEALEGSGHAFFENTKRLAHQVEQEEHVQLDYLGDRHESAHPANGAGTGDRSTLTSEPLTPADRDVALGMVDTVFDAVDEQLALSLEVATSNRFRVA